MKLLYITTLCLFSVFAAKAQDNIVKSLEQRVTGQGTVNIYQDPRIEALLGVSSRTSAAKGALYADSEEKKILKAFGYRVQVYAGNNSRHAREEALSVSGRVKEYFPEVSVYTQFTSPRWLCRVGDFRSIEEADAMMRKLKTTGVFKEVSIVKEQINIPL